MEKSGKIQLTLEELKAFNKGESLPSVLAQWGLKDMAELKEVLEAGQYEVINL